jgi:hypothetical protein
LLNFCFGTNSCMGWSTSRVYCCMLN